MHQQIISLKFDSNYYKLIKQMAQLFLTNCSIIIIKHFSRLGDQDVSFCLGNQSIIRSQVFFEYNQLQSRTENQLFYVQLEGGNKQSKIAIEFEQAILLRHKLSNKYLSYSTDKQDQDNDSTVKLQLSEKGCLFKFMPCFIYQTKISNKIKFLEDVYLSTELSSTKLGFVSVRTSQTLHREKAILGLNQKEKLILHSYYQTEEEQTGYHFGQAVWLTHVDSETFLTVANRNKRTEVAFQPLNREAKEQSIKGLWLIDAVKTEVGGKLHFNEQFYLKSLSANKYLTFSEKFQMVGGQKTFTISLQQRPRDLSKFIFESLKEEQNSIKKRSYLIIKHVKSETFIGTRKSRYNSEQIYLPFMTFDYFQDEDLFKMTETEEADEQTFRFIFSFKDQLRRISIRLRSPEPLAHKLVSQISELYHNIIQQLDKLSKGGGFSEVQNQLGEELPEFYFQIQEYHRRILSQPSNARQLTRLIGNLYQIMRMLVEGDRLNQEQLYNNLNLFLTDIFQDYGVEQLLMQIFRNNYFLLCKLPDPLPKLHNRNLINCIFEKILGSNIKEKNDLYWKKIIKIFDFLDIILYHSDKVIDVNQRLVSTELFQRRAFDLLFFQIKTIKQRIKINHPLKKIWCELDQVKEPLILTVVERIFKLFSQICQDRNFISKSYVHDYLNQSDNGVKIIITYLNIPISPHLSNHLYSLITNCYIDSSPRINRTKPLSIILFNMDKDESEGIMEGQKSNRLQTVLLNKESNYVGKSLRLSNVLTSLKVQQPSLNEQELDLYKQQLNERIFSENWTQELLKSICMLIRLESYSIPELANIKAMMEEQIMKQTLENNIIPYAMEILDQLRIYCEELEIKKVTLYLKYKFSQIKKGSIQNRDVSYFLPYSIKLKSPLRKTNNNQEQVYMIEPEIKNQFQEDYNETVSVLNQLYPSQKLKKHLFEMFINSENYSFEIISSLFRQIIRCNFSKLSMIRLLTKGIVITGDEVKKFEELFQLYKKMNHLNCISQHWLYSKHEQPTEYKQFITAMVEFTNFMYDNYVLSSEKDKRFRKTSKLNINRQLLLQNMGVHEIVLTFLGDNYHLLDEKIKKKLTKVQRHVFQECLEFLYHFCQSCKSNIKIIQKNLGVIEKLRGSIEVGQTKLLIMIYQVDDNLVKQINVGIVETAICKIIKDLKVVHLQECEYNPEFMQFLLNITYSKGKPHKKNIALIQKSIEKEANFRGLLFLEKRGNQLQLALSSQYYKKSPLRVPFLYHKKVIKLLCVMIQHLEYMGTRIRNRLKHYLSQESLFKLLSLPDIYSHQGLIPELNFLLKKQLFALASLYLDKNDSLNKLYESKSLEALLDHYMHIFLTKPFRTTIVEQGEEYMVPFLSEYQQELKYDRENQRDYYNQMVHPLLSKLYNIFDKMSNKEGNINFRKLKLLLEDIRPLQLCQDHLLRHIQYGIDLINLKWRNFVDADEDNSQEQKYAKKTLLQVLKHSEANKLIEKQRQSFYEILAQNENMYFKVMGNFIKMASANQNSDASEDDNLIFYQIIQQLAEYLQWTTTKGNQFKGLEGEVIVQTLIGYVTRQSFDYSNEISRKSFYQILRIFVILLQKQETDQLQKVFYDYFKSEISSYRFFACLNSALIEIFDRIEGQKIHEQINFALNQLSLCGEQQKCEIDREALKFLRLLCRYIPFTDFLRDQPYTISIDFLELIFNSFYIMIKRHESASLKITIAVVDILEPVMDCMIWMMNGCNITNQGYLIDTKFPMVLVEMLKKEDISVPDNKGELSKRSMLLEEVVQFYQSNGISIRDVLEQNLKFLDFKHIYLLNRFKLAMLKLLHQSTLANERALNKLKILIPIQLLKINLIWTYNDLLAQKLAYSEENVLRQREEWRDVVQRENIEGTFLMIGFYFYVFIQYYKKDEKESKDDDEAETAQDQQKQKQKVIKKFFSSIAERQKKQQKEKYLEKDQQFGKQMTKFYKNYYAAYRFYSSKTLTIEANVFQKLTRLYFPRLPLCDKVTDEMKEKQAQEAERISQQEKIKSLMEFQQESYININGQEIYFKKLSETSETLANALKLLKSEDDIHLIVWVVSCLITINYLLFDYNTPYNKFSDLVGYFITPTDFLSIFMLLLELILLFFGIILLINMIFKKIPELMEIFGTKFQKQKAQNQTSQQEATFKDSYAYYLVTNMFFNLAFDIYIMGFCFLTIVHPLFAGFELIYIITRIAIGQQIIVAIKETAFSLFAATGLLIICNYVYSMLIYVSFTYDIGYGGTCKNLLKCLLMVFDQSLKGDAGFLGNVDTDYTYNIINIKLLCEIFYLLFVKKVIFQIFSGTIIDKFSELRQKSEETEEDEKSNCYICGLERFQIDFELQGFQEHVNTTHNKFNYVFYLFYLRRKSKEEFGIEQNYIWQLHEKEINDWIPDGTSLLKEQKGGEDEQEQKRNHEQQYEKYFQKKMSELTKMKQKMEFIGNQLKETHNQV